jgi:hypothetical protein
LFSAPGPKVRSVLRFSLVRSIPVYVLLGALRLPMFFLLCPSSPPILVPLSCLSLLFCYLGSPCDLMLLPWFPGAASRPSIRVLHIHLCLFVQAVSGGTSSLHCSKGAFFSLYA